MLPDSLEYVTVVRLRGEVTVDEYQNKAIDWSDPDRLEIPGSMFQPLGGEEVLAGRDALVTRWEWFGPWDADVKSTDRIEYRGVAYEVDGAIQRPEGLGLDHSRAVCKEVAG